jgi:hypothetical protein
MGPSLMNRARVGLVVPGALDRVALARVDPAARAGPVVRDPVDPAGRVDLADPGDRVGLADIKDRAGQADKALAVLADKGPAGPALAGRVDLTCIKDLADPEVRVGRLAVRVGLVALVARPPADREARHRRRMPRRALLTAAARRWAGPRTHRTVSAHPVMARRLRLKTMDGLGITDRRPAYRRVIGTDRRPQVAGTVLRRPEVGTGAGTDRRGATSRSRSAISDRSTTTTTTPSRCSARSSADGASGSWVSGFRCTRAI